MGDLTEALSNMETPQEMIRLRRTERGIERQALAEAIGVSEQDVWDLESNCDELEICFSLRQVFGLTQTLGFSRPSDLFDADFCGQPIGFGVLREKVSGAILAHGVKFEDEIGWAIQSNFDTLSGVVDSFPVIFVQRLCARLSVSWLAALNGLFADHVAANRVGNDVD